MFGVLGRSSSLSRLMNIIQHIVDVLVRTYQGLALALYQSPFSRLGQEEWKVLYYNIQVGAIFPCLLEGGSDNPDKSRCSPSPPRPPSHHPDRRGIIL
jgi:hypothetical protein